MVERIRTTTKEERARLLEAAGYNLFRLRSRDVIVDLLTDSGTGAMSDEAWGAMIRGDESYAGARSFDVLRESVLDVFGMEHVLPVHQGRGAEHVVMGALVSGGMKIPGNAAFDTTTAHVEHRGAEAVDCTVEEAYEPAKIAAFKGDADLEALDRFLRKCGAGKVPFVLMTLTCNTVGGQPVSMANLRGVREISDRHRVPLFLDIARVAENALFIQRREAGYRSKSVRDIVRQTLSLADLAMMSAKKDALVNIGGLIVTSHRELYERLLPLEVLYEGFPTYGGLAGRDLEAIAVGLREGTEDEVVECRVAQVARFAERMRREKVPIVEPVGGHAVYVDAGALLPHVRPHQFPGHALACELYLEGGVRGCEIGSLLAGRDPSTGKEKGSKMELLRLAIPRRVYNDRHLELAAKAAGKLRERASSIHGYEFVEEPKALRHFLATMRPVRRAPDLVVGGAS
jgi:tryptophanase